MEREGGERDGERREEGRERERVGKRDDYSTLYISQAGLACLVC